jgi:crossover junction endodeoxyribonuclease RusA
VIEFFAAGRPRTKGSTRSFAHRTTGRVVTTGANPRTAAWQGVVAHAAHAAGVRPAATANLVIEFRFARPAGHLRTGRHAGAVRTTAPLLPTSRAVGDLDKLLRAVLDALTGVAYADDSNVVGVVASKRWTTALESEGARVAVGAWPGWPR